MSASRHRPKSGGRRSFGLVIFFLAMMPTPVGLQDLAALIARQPAVSDRWRQYVRVTPFGTVQAATFSFPQPLGTHDPGRRRDTHSRASIRARSTSRARSAIRALNPLAEPTPPIAVSGGQPHAEGRSAGAARASRSRRAATRLDKPKKAPEKTQDRAQFEQPKPRRTAASRIQAGAGSPSLQSRKSSRQARSAEADRKA